MVLFLKFCGQNPIKPLAFFFASRLHSIGPCREKGMQVFEVRRLDNSNSSITVFFAHDITDLRQAGPHTGNLEAMSAPRTCFGGNFLTSVTTSVLEFSARNTVSPVMRNVQILHALAACPH